MKYRFILLLTAAIWGFAFAFQRDAMTSMGPFGFNGVRFAMGCLSLAPIAIVSRLKIKKKEGHSETYPWKLLLGAGAAVGVVLFIAASLQQTALVTESSGKIGFITGLYIIFIPLLGLLIGQQPGWKVWAGVALGATGLALLSEEVTIGLTRGEMLGLGCAIFFAAHVQLVGHYSPSLKSIDLAMIQFGVCSIASLCFAGLFETLTIGQLREALVPLLYTGIASVGIAYTLQVVGQKGTPPVLAGLIMSLEAVFAVIGGWMLLGEQMGAAEIGGCALMMLGMIFAQLESPASPPPEADIIAGEMTS